MRGTRQVSQLTNKGHPGNSTYVDSREHYMLLYCLRHLCKLLHRVLERDCYKNVYEPLSQFHMFCCKQTTFPK